MFRYLNTLVSSCFLFLSFIPGALAAIDGKTEKAASTVSYQHVMNWALGLFVVLCLFFFCVWFVRKMGVLPLSSKQKMTVVTGLSLGMREKLVLVQVGDKQLVLGVTPGRIDNLLVLEGNEQLLSNEMDDQVESDFSKKLKQVMTGSTHE